MQFKKGFSLISLMVGVATSAVLLLTIMQLASISKTNFFRSEATTQLYVDGRNAITLLRQYVPMAGVGIQQPFSAPMVAINYAANTAFSPPNTALAGAAALSNWVYMGPYLGVNPGVSPSYSYNAGSGLSQPQYCDNTITTNQPNSNFMALLQGNCYYGSNPGWVPTVSSLYFQGYCCNSTGSCVAPIYGCGASSSTGGWAGSTYQKLIAPVSGTMGTGTNSDTLSVYFYNRGPETMLSYDGSPMPADTNIPPLTLYNYTFQVNSASATLEMTDAASGKVYNIANNVEYMAVLAGESDRIVNNTATGSSIQLPEMNRYVRFGTSNLYPYRIAAVRIALVVRSNLNTLPVASNAPMNLMTGNGNTMITYTPPVADTRMRKVFVTTIYLNAYALPEYRMHCSPTNGTGGSYQLKVGGIPFVSTPWTTHDQCCASSNATCSSFINFAACETQRMTGGC